MLREFKTQITFAKKIHLSGFGSAELSAWQAPHGDSFGKGTGEILPTKAQVILSNTYILSTTTQARHRMVPSTARCLHQGSWCLQPGTMVFSGTELP